MKTIWNIPNWIQVGIIIFYRLLNEKYYVDYVVSIFSYSGYTNDADLYQYMLSWIFLLVMILFYLKSFKSTDILWQYLLLFLMCIKIIPLSIMMGRVKYELEYIYLNFIFWILFLGLYNIFPNIRLLSNSYIRKNSKVFNKVLSCIIILFICAVVYVSGKYTGFHLHTSLIDVYDIRFEQRENNYPMVFGYILAASMTLCPLIFCLFIDKKKYLLALVFVFVIYIDFSIAGIKSIIFATIIGVILKYYYNAKYKNFFFTYLTIVIFVCFVVFNETILYAIAPLFFRAFYIPSGQDYEYYTFFKIFEPDFYRNSILRRFGFESPYANTSVDIAVGEYFKPEVEGIRANNGLISEAFANFGMVGCVILPIILVVYIKFVSSCSKGIDETYICLISLLFCNTLISTFIPTAILSSGILFMMIFLVCYKATLIKSVPIQKDKPY